MARRRRQWAHPVAARRRRVIAQTIGLALLFGGTAFLVFMAVTAT